MTIYRYLNQTFIDQLFYEGKYRLSPVSTYKEIEDNRRDESEAKLLHSIKSLSGDFSTSDKTMIANLGIPGENGTIRKGATLNINMQIQNHYCICASTVLSKELLKHFNVDGCFEIFNKEDFTLLIAEALMEKHGGGLSSLKEVVYVDEKTITHDIEKLSPTFRNNFNMMWYFLKLKKYSHENEYRFIFTAPTQNDYLPIIDLNLNVKRINSCCRMVSL